MKRKIVRFSVVFCLFILIGFNVVFASSLATDMSNKTLSLSGDYHALVIGNAEYKDPLNVWSPLETAVSDAKEVSNVFKSKYGFKNVFLVENASRSKIINSFIELQQSINENDNVVIYYAGHGHLDEDKVSYWIPVDARGDDISTYLHQSVIVSEVRRIAKKAKHTLVIADSCFSGDLLSPHRGSRGLNFIAKTKATPTKDENIGLPYTQHFDNESYRYYHRVANDKSVQVITAGGNEYVNDTFGNSGHSPFTYFLLKKLRDNDQKFVTASQLAEEVKPLVGNNAPQVPQNGVLYNAGDEGGEFVFSHAQIAALNLELPQDVVAPQVPGLQTQSIEQTSMSKEKNTNKPWYKNPWIWVGAIAGGALVASQVGSGSDGGGNCPPDKACPEY